MRILWLSNAPWVSTGYGNQTQLFVPRLKELGHEVAVCAFYGLQGSSLVWDGIEVYPRHGHLYAADIIGAHAKHFKADIVLSLIDVWVYEPAIWANLCWVPWVPIDHEPLAPRMRDVLGAAFQTVVFSRFGEAQCEEADIDTAYVPHGIDTATFCPGNKAEARKAIGCPEDRFLVGIVSANKGHPSRKNFAEQIEAFARLHRRHDDALLYLHTQITRDSQNVGIDLEPLCNHFGLRFGRDVLTCDQYGYLLGQPATYMANMYRSLDVLLNVARGEGFGIPIVEAQACGTPVIVGDWTAMGELCFAGWKVPKDQTQRDWTPLRAWQYIPRPGAIAERLEAAYKRAGSDLLRQNARQGALAYDVDRVAHEYWVPVLNKIAERIAALNDAERTAAKWREVG